MAESWPNGDALDQSSTLPPEAQAVPVEAGEAVNRVPPATPESGQRRVLGAGWLDALSVAEGGLRLDVGIMLELASIYLPVIGPVFSPAVPTPFVVLMLRRGPRVTLLAAAVAGFLVTVLAGPHFGWRMVLEAVVGMLLGWAMRRKLHPLGVLALGTALVALVTFVAALGVIFLVGPPVHDVVAGLRNGFASVAAVVATIASVVGAESAWLAIRPTLVAVALLALRLWPLVLFGAIACFAFGAVVLYYAVATFSVRLLGYEVRPFPPPRIARAVRWLVGWRRPADDAPRQHAPPPETRHDETREGTRA